MKAKKVLTTLVILPLLAGCGSQELVIPTVDVETIIPELPDRPVYNVGEIASSENIDYLDFYELSDMHGAVNEESHSEGSYIGLTKLAGYLNVKRSLNPGGTVVVSSGDMFQGSADSNLTRGYMVNYAMNYMGFDSMAIGNHEFDWTDTWLKKNANLDYKGNKIPFISSNIVTAGTTETPDFLEKSTIVERGQYKIGIVGSIGETLKSSILKSCVEGYDFMKQADAINAEAAKLKEVDHCDVVVLTAHDDIDNLTSAGLKNVDAIFGGHAHIDKEAEISGIPAVQTQNYGKSIAHIRLGLDKDSKAVVSFTKELDSNPLGLAGIKADENVAKIMNSYRASIDDIKGIELGKCDETLVKDGALKAICVESMYQGALKGIKDLGLDIKEEEILATFHNVNGGIRADIEAGKITYDDIYNPFPFDNEIVLYKVSGSLFKQRASTYSAYATRRTFGELDEINKDATYYLVLTDFIALSKSYFGKTFNIEESDLIRTGKVVRDEVANFVYQKGSIKADDFNSYRDPYRAISIF